MECLKGENSLAKPKPTNIAPRAPPLHLRQAEAAIRVASHKGGLMRRTSHQHGSLKLADRRKGKVWEFRWREVQIDGSVCRKNIVVGTLEEFPTESAAQSAVDAIRLTINRQTPQQLLKNVSVETLVKHYQEHELPDIFSNQKPAPGNSDEHHKSYSTQYAY